MSFVTSAPAQSSSTADIFGFASRRHRRLPVASLRLQFLSAPAPPPQPSGVDAGPSSGPAEATIWRQATQPLFHAYAETEAATDSALELGEADVYQQCAVHAKQPGEWAADVSVLCKEPAAATGLCAVRLIALVCSFLTRLTTRRNRLLRMSDEVGTSGQRSAVSASTTAAATAAATTDPLESPFPSINMIPRSLGRLRANGQSRHQTAGCGAEPAVSGAASDAFVGYQQVLAGCRAWNPGSDTTSALQWEHFAQAHTRKSVTKAAKAEQVTIAKDDLRCDWLSSPFWLWGDSERLAEPIRSDQLSEVVLTIPPPQHGIWQHRSQPAGSIG